MALDAKLLYPDRDQRRRFEARLFEFLKVDTCADVISYQAGVVSYLTESVIPSKIDARPPVLLLFGNPSPESVERKCFFAGEKNRREHRFWRAMRESGVLSFDKGTFGTDASRTRAMFDLAYASPLRVGLAVFYSMPSPASDPKWSGVAGLRRLFGARALREIAECEKQRVEKLIKAFISGQLGSRVVAFQKDAYLCIKSNSSPEKKVSLEERLYAVESRCSCADVKLFRLPPTRYMVTPLYTRLLQQVSSICKVQWDEK
jgi:hypothetical protein